MRICMLVEHRIHVPLDNAVLMPCTLVLYMWDILRASAVHTHKGKTRRLASSWENASCGRK